LRGLYSVEDFGAFDLYFSILSVLVAGVTLRYENAIMLPKFDKIAANLVFLSILFSTFFSTVLLILVIFFQDLLIDLLNFPKEYSIGLYLIPVTIFLFTGFQTINFWLIRKNKIRVSSINKIVRRTTEAGAQISFSYIGKNFGLFLGEVLGNLANFIYGIIALFKSGFSIRHLSLRLLKYALVKYREFPLYNLMPNFLSTISFVIPIFLLNSLYGLSEVAQMSLARQLLVVPAALFAGSISQILYKKLSELKNNGQSLINEIKKIFFLVLFASIAEVFLFFFLGEYIFALVFGDEWGEAGRLAGYLVFAFALQFLVSPFSIILWVLGKLKLQAIWQVINFIIIGVLYFLKMLSFVEFIQLYTALTVLSYLIYGIMIAYKLIIYEREIQNIT